MNKTINDTNNKNGLDLNPPNPIHSYNVQHDIEILFYKQYIILTKMIT